MSRHQLKKNWKKSKSFWITHKIHTLLVKRFAVQLLWTVRREHKFVVSNKCDLWFRTIEVIRKCKKELKMKKGRKCSDSTFRLEYWNVVPSRRSHTKNKNKWNAKEYFFVLWSDKEIRDFGSSLLCVALKSLKVKKNWNSLQEFTFVWLEKANVIGRICCDETQSQSIKVTNQILDIGAMRNL